MKIGIIGYGRMGKEIEKIALDRGHTVDLIIDVDTKHLFTSEHLSKLDVAIDFSIPSAAVDNIHTCLEAGLPLVVGTTGWHDKLEDVKKACEDKNGSVLHGSNFSVGVNIFFEINKRLAEIMNKFPDYNVSMEETHHTKKLDAPSGTAISLAEDVIANMDRVSKWELDNDKDLDVLNIHAIRKENVPGIHKVTYDCPIDTIEIFHSAKNRKGFALGAVLASEFLVGKKGVYNVKQMFDF